MTAGRVYVRASDDPARAGGERITTAIVPLLRLHAAGAGRGRLWGRHVRVRNGGALNVPAGVAQGVRPVPIGDAQPDTDGNFLYEPGRGGGRLDKVVLAPPNWRERYIQAAHFGEVNTYYHLDRIAAYIDDLLRALGSASLPPVTAVVNAHHAATELDGRRDGVRRGERWLPFQGGHYRLPSRRFDISEHAPLAPAGEIHLGPGWQLLEHGALVEAAGSRYRANAAHNAGILYHEYGHHLTRHTADFQANSLRPSDRQNNRKTALDEGMCDYWAATMLGTPHIWAWHRRHDDQEIHPRSLASSKTMAAYDARPGADPHANGTIWAAALWDLRTRLAATEPDGIRRSDQLVVQALVLLGQRGVGPHASVHAVRQARDSFAAGLTALLQADEVLHRGRYRARILSIFAARGIALSPCANHAEWRYGGATGRLGRERHPATEVPAPGIRHGGHEARGSCAQ